jgi:hypothetical protein
MVSGILAFRWLTGTRALCLSTRTPNKILFPYLGVLCLLDIGQNLC